MQGSNFINIDSENLSKNYLIYFFCVCFQKYLLWFGLKIFLPVKDGLINF